MPTLIEGHFNAGDRQWAIIVGRFNSFLSERLSEGAVDTLVRNGASPDAIDIYKVPGAFEIPLAAKRIANTGKYAGVICLGALIRGSTPHFDYISSEVTKGIAAVSLDLDVVMSYGVITCDTLDQAIERSGTKAGNKGADAALAAIEMVDLFSRMS